MIRSSFFPNQRTLTLKQIYSLIDVKFSAGFDEEQIFSSVSSLAEANELSVALLHNARYAKEARTTKAGLCLTTEALAHHLPACTHVISHPAPYRAYAAIASAMYPIVQKNAAIHPTAVIDPTAEIGDNCSIGAHTTIGAYAKIGANSRIDTHVSIGDFVEIGGSAIIGASVIISHALIGSNVYIKPGTCIGQQGFGFHMDEKGHFDVPQLGIVEIGNNVQIGTNVCIDRASLGSTKICDGVRIDNLVQIAHNVYIGPMSVIVAQTGIAGSTRLGRFVILAGQAGLAGHLTLGDNVKVAAQSGLMRDVEAGETVAGTPAIPVRDWHKQTIILQRLIKEKPDGAKRTR